MYVLYVQLVPLVVHGTMHWGQKKLYTSVEVPSAVARVPSQWPFASSVTSVG